MPLARANRLKDVDLLNGPILGKIFQFVLPLLLTNLLQNLYNAADMVIVGLSNVDGAIGAIGTTTAMVSCILNIFMGLAVGSSVMVARAIGERNRDKASDAVHTAMSLSLIAGVIAMGIGLLVSRPVLRFMGDQGHILDLATLYTRIYFLGVPFISMTNFLISIFRAKGDTRTPLIVLTITGLMNVAMNLLFVLGFGMSVDGVSLATGLSNMASMLILSIILSKDSGPCKLDYRKLRLERFSLKGILYNGLPAGFQGALFSVSNMIIQSSIININNITCPGGSDIIDGNAAGASLESFGFVTVNSVCQAAVTFVSQHYGAKKFRRIGKVIRDCYFVSFLIAEVVSLLILAFRAPLIRIYVTSPAAIKAAETRLIYMLSIYFTLASMDTGSGIVRGLNRSLLSTTVTLLGSCALRIVWIATVVQVHMSLEFVYMSYPISWAVTGLCHFIVAMATRRKLLKMYPDAD